MNSKNKFFKKSKILPIDKFFENVLYDNRNGYYNAKNPFGKKGDFITAPQISQLFSEMIAIWIISTWEIFGRPKNFDIIELGPGDASLVKVLLNVFERFPEFNSVKNIYLYEKSKKLKNNQKKILKGKNVNWIKNFNKIKKGPVIFFGNEFFDAIPIKQYKRFNNSYFEKNFTLDKKDKIIEIFKDISKSQLRYIKSFKSLKNLKFIEFPMMGFKELKKIIKKISQLSGCLLLIDYGYLVPNSLNTLQSVIKHKKNNILKNLGNADITSHVNFTLLNEFLLKNKLQTKKVVTQKRFLENMGIMERSKIIEDKMKFSEKTNLYLKLKRLLSPKLMGNLFKVILAYKFKRNDFYGFN